MLTPNGSIINKLSLIPFKMKAMTFLLATDTRVKSGQERGSLFQTIIKIQKGRLLDRCGMYAAGKTAEIKRTAHSKGVFLF